MNHHYDDLFTRIDYSRQDLSGILYESCRFERCTLDETNLKHATFENCTFEACSLMMTNLTGTTFDKVCFHECKVMGVNFSLLNDFAIEVHFKKCRIISALFTALALPKTSFEGSALEETTFRECALKEANFSDTSCRATLFDSCDLTSACFTGSSGFSIHPCKNTLKKAQFDVEGAMALLSPFDITLKI
ncbi:MAG: pentapeptide repeat-containing protein [Desulfobacterales bacterium]|nr:pentapeptide repeat-containing protein [Desulfobacterales bacterium]